MTGSYNIKSSNNVFHLFPEYELKQQKFLNAYKIENQKDTVEIKAENKTSSAKKDFHISPVPKVLTAGILAIMLSKGVHNGAIKKLSAELADSESARSAIYYAGKGKDKTVSALRTFSNITPIKDILTEKILSLTSFTKKFADGTRSLFKKIVDRTLFKKYEKVETQVRNMSSLLEKYCILNIMQLDETQLSTKIKIKDKVMSLAEWCELLRLKVSELDTSFSDSFSAGAVTSRGKQREQLLNGTREKINDMFFKDGGLFNLENYRGYATEKATSSSQQKLKTQIITARKKVTNNIGSIVQSIEEKTTELSRSIKPDDKESPTIINNLCQKLDNFAKCSGSAEAAERLKISKGMISDIDEVKSLISVNSTYTEKERNELIAKLEEIRNYVLYSDEQSKGILENIMTILKGLNKAKTQGGAQIISDTEFKRLQKISDGISKGLKDASDTEIGEYFIKQAEIEVGSAATDVMGLVLPIGAGVYAIGKSEDNDQRVSATLRTCIPLIGSFGTFLYGTTKMFSGAKNLIFAGVSAFVLNKFGGYLDNLYKNYKKTGSIVKVAKNELNPNHLIKPQSQNK